MFVFLTCSILGPTQPSIYGYGVLIWGLSDRGVMLTIHLMTNLRMVRIQNCCSGDTIERNGMGGECSAYGRQERRI